jgi:hypothetical protein
VFSNDCIPHQIAIVRFYNNATVAGMGGPSFHAKLAQWEIGATWRPHERGNADGKHDSEAVEHGCTVVQSRSSISSLTAAPAAIVALWVGVCSIEAGVCSTYM